MRAVLDGIFYTAAQYVSVALRLLSRLIVRAWVAPAAFGGVNLAQGVESYFATYKGIYRNAIDRDVPIMRASGQDGRAEHLVHSAYALVVWSSIVQAVLFFWLGLASSDTWLRVGWWTVGAANVFSALSATHRIAIKAHNEIRAHNVALVWGSVLEAVVIVGLAWLFGAPGYFMGFVAAALVEFAAFEWRARRIGLRLISFKWSRALLRPLLRTGLSVGIFKLLLDVLLTMDRYFVVAFLDVTSLGYYSLGSMMMGVLYLLPRSLIGSYSPRMFALLGTGQIEAAGRVAVKLQRLAVLLSVITFGGLMLAMGPVIERFLPAYHHAVPVLQVMLWSGYFLGANAISQHIHIGLGAVRRASVLTAMACLVLFFVELRLASWGLLAIAAGAVIATGVYGILMSASAERLIGQTGLVLWTAGGGILVGVLHALEASEKPYAALLALVGIAAGSAAYAVHVTGVDLRTIPREARSYLRGRS